MICLVTAMTLIIMIIIIIKKIKNKKNNNNNNKETSLLTYDQFAFHYHRLKFYIKILKDLKH